MAYFDHASLSNYSRLGESDALQYQRKVIAMGELAIVKDVLDV